MPNGKKKRKQYYRDFDLATFISEDRCIVCGNPRVLLDIDEDAIPDHYDPPPNFPIVTHAEEYFFAICTTCRQRISDALCLKCGKKLKVEDLNLDFFFLHVGQALAKEIIRYRSELTKWVPVIQDRMKKDAPITDDGKKNVKGLFGKKKKKE